MEAQIDHDGLRESIDQRIREYFRRCYGFYDYLWMLFSPTAQHSTQTTG